jgi:hypothetical protein
VFYWLCLRVLIVFGKSGVYFYAADVHICCIKIYRSIFCHAFSKKRGKNTFTTLMEESVVKLLPRLYGKKFYHAYGIKRGKSFTLM